MGSTKYEIERKLIIVVFISLLLLGVFFMIKDKITQYKASRNEILSKGSENKEKVLELQQKLNKLGANLTEDGIFGPNTEKALLSAWGNTEIRVSEIRKL